MNKIEIIGQNSNDTGQLDSYYSNLGISDPKQYIVFKYYIVDDRNPEFEEKYNIPHPQDITGFEDYYGQYEQELPLVQENSARSFDYIYDFIKRADRLGGKDRFDAFYWIVELFNNIPAERYTEDILMQNTMDEIESDMAHILACKENEEQPNYLIK